MDSGAHLILETPTGDFYVRGGPGRAVSTGWVDMLTPAARDALHAPPDGPPPSPRLVDHLRRAIRGEDADFTDVPLPAGTPFQRAVWRATRDIPRGGTRTYAEIAVLAGHPRAARAVGQAMRRNPQPIITPCHRVVGRTGLGGFAGDPDGAPRVSIKKHLISLERRTTEVVTDPARQRDLSRK